MVSLELHALQQTLATSHKVASNFKELLHTYKFLDYPISLARSLDQWLTMFRVLENEALWKGGGGEWR